MPRRPDDPVQPGETGDTTNVDDQFSPRQEVVVSLLAEEIAIAKRTTDTASVQISTATRLREHVVDETLSHERVDIEHVPVGRYVESVPPVRQEGDLTIMPVVDEVVTVERKLLLREEVHIRRVRSTEHHLETLQLREQEVVVTRIPANK